MVRVAGVEQHHAVGQHLTPHAQSPKRPEGRQFSVNGEERRLVVEELLLNQVADEATLAAAGGAEISVCRCSISSLTSP